MEDKIINPEVTSNKLLEALESLQMDFDNPSMIQDNKIIYFYDGKMYRSHMPPQNNRAMAEQKKNEFYVELLQSGKYLTKNQLKKVLIEKQGIDLEGMEKQQNKLIDKRKEAHLKLAVKLSEETEEINELKQIIEDLKREHFLISLEVYNLLSPCIEDQVETKYVEYLTYICTEVSEVDKLQPDNNDNWKRVWNTFEDFKKDTTRVPDVAVKAMGDLLIVTRA